MHWLNSLTLRERWALFSGGLSLSIILGYLFWWKPLVTAHDQLKNIITTQQATLRWMQSAAAEVRQLQQHTQSLPAKTNSQSLLSLLDKSIRHVALDTTNKRIESKNNQKVQVNFSDVSFTELIRWLEHLYNQYQVQVDTIRIERLSRPDRVKVRLSLSVIRM